MRRILDHGYERFSNIAKTANCRAVSPVREFRRWPCSSALASPHARGSKKHEAQCSRLGDGSTRKGTRADSASLTKMSPPLVVLRRSDPAADGIVGEHVARTLGFPPQHVVGRINNAIVGVIAGDSGEDDRK